MTITATLVRAELPDFTGRASLYSLSSPVPINRFDPLDDDETPTDPVTTEYVIVSSTRAMFSGPETYIFPANAEGNITNWLEMEGSYRGSLDHERAIQNAGWLLA